MRPLKSYMNGMEQYIRSILVNCVNKIFFSGLPKLTLEICQNLVEDTFLNFLGIFGSEFSGRKFPRVCSKTIHSLFSILSGCKDTFSSYSCKYLYFGARWLTPK